jgi:hypothetical protein
MTFTTARQMFGAELLKLRRNRPLMAFASLLSVVVVALFFGYDAIQHASDPSAHGPAGGIDGFQRTARVLGFFFGALVAALIGTEAGTADLSSGVFRDLVATGRSRIALFAVRTPAAIVLTLAFTGAAFALGAVLSFVFAGGLPTPAASTIIDSALWVMLGNTVVCAMAVGLGSMTGSRGVTLTGVIGWQTVATQLLLQATSLGSVRGGLLDAALANIAPIHVGLGSEVSMSAGAAAMVAAAWFAIPTAAGAWRTRVRDA